MEIGTHVKLIERLVERSTEIPVGSTGQVVKTAWKAILVRFPKGERWCWPSELMPA